MKKFKKKSQKKYEEIKKKEFHLRSLRQIHENSNYPIAVCLGAHLKLYLENAPKNSRVSLVPTCLKRLDKSSFYYRRPFLEPVRSGLLASLLDDERAARFLETLKGSTVDPVALSVIYVCAFLLAFHVVYPREFAAAVKKVQFLITDFISTLRLIYRTARELGVLTTVVYVLAGTAFSLLAKLAKGVRYLLAQFERKRGKKRGKK